MYILLLLLWRRLHISWLSHDSFAVIKWRCKNTPSLVCPTRAKVIITIRWRYLCRLSHDINANAMTFVFAMEKDKGDGRLICFDIVCAWHGKSKLLTSRRLHHYSGCSNWQRVVTRLSCYIEIEEPPIWTEFQDQNLRYEVEGLHWIKPSKIASLSKFQKFAVKHWPLR